MKTLCGQPVTDEEYEWAMAQDPGSLDDEIKTLRALLGRLNGAIGVLESDDGDAPPCSLIAEGEAILEISDRIALLVAHRHSRKILRSELQ